MIGVIGVNMYTTRTWTRSKLPVAGRPPHGPEQETTPDRSVQVRTAKQATRVPVNTVVLQPDGSPHGQPGVLQWSFSPPEPVSPQTAVVVSIVLKTSFRNADPKSTLCPLIAARMPARLAPLISMLR